MTKVKKRYLSNKFKKKGFTLIELLAIILILAILVLIAIPFITKIVEEASKEAFRQTTKGIATAIEKQCDLQVISDEQITDAYAVENYKVIAGNSIKVKGRLPLYANANADDNCNVQIVAHNNKWCATKAYGEDKVNVTKYIEGLCKIGDTGPTLVSGNDTWDGWITMTLYYPASSTDREWRLGSQGELRYDQTLMWQAYTGAITVKLDRVEDVWIRYKLNGKTVTIPPAGTVLVDIEPDSYGTSKKVDSVNVKITYDEDATVKEYRIGDSGWMTYTGEFTVTENVIIEARASKPDNVYDTDGNLVVSRKAIGRDAVYIGNIGINETELAAPTIQRLAGASGDEVAQVRVTYPAEAVKKIYKVNYGIEENYTSEISIKKYRTYIIAYYYDASGKRSQAASIYINNLDDPSDGKVPGTPDPPGDYDPKPPLEIIEKPPVTPSYRILAPTITGSPTTPTTGAVTVTVTPQVAAQTIYIKKGNGKYEVYNGPITVKTNTLITAYYITTSGETSERGYYIVKNIVEGNKPYLAINANPYPYSTSYGETSINISLDYSNADTVEYSENGIEYKPYTGAFTVTKNETVYAKATNSYGTTLRQLSITNIGGTGPTKPDVLSVNIMVAPEPAVSTNLVAKATVKIDYDSKATKKYYTLGRYGALTEYTGEFEVTDNTIIYAYALSSNGKGNDSKKIDNLLNGISEPNIVANPSNDSIASSTIITIDYDKNAVVKRYSINGGTLRDYVAPIEIDENSTIYAYNSNAKGDEADSTYYVNNISPKTSIFLIDKGYYYILKLNYPEISTGREYKWKKDGIWKSYDEKGILLIKPEYKDELLDVDSNFKVGIEDDNGNIIDFTNHWYIVESDFKSLQEYIFMRWDTTTPPTPEIVLNTLEPAKSVTASILYNKALIKKEYKIVDKDGIIVQDWTDYNSAINISKNNTVIYARGMDETEVWSETAVYKVVNIDENQPVIKLTTDLVTATRKLGIKVSVTDDVMVGKVKWAKGILGESYFASGGTEILNNSIVNITENAYYTFYAEDGVGNKQVYTINVENIDLTPPIITISATPEDTIGTTAQVTINYGDSATKQYKIGNSTTWLTYSAAFNVSSYTVLTNNWQNADGTVTIYAKGVDSVGNEVIVTEKLLNLDLDMPNKPVIVSNSGYPILTTYGVRLDDVTTVTYDSRKDIDNYYSVDGGTTWLPYTGTVNLSSGTIIAKSVKKGSGLEASASKTVSMPADAVPLAGYDGNDTTYYKKATSYIFVDPSLYNQNIKIKVGTHSNGGYLTIQYLNETGTSLLTRSYTTTATFYITEKVPVGTVKIYFSLQTANGSIYEIFPDNTPVIVATQTLPKLTTYGVESEYSMATINYYATSVQRLYSFDNATWYDYADLPIRVNIGQTLYAKGIDKNGNQSRSIASYTAAVRTDSVPPTGYDGNDATYYKIANSYILVDPSIQGQNIKIKVGTHSNSGNLTVRYLDSSGTALLTRTYNTYATFYITEKVPVGTDKIYFSLQTANGSIYEIFPDNTPVINATQYLPKLTLTGVNNEYSMVSLNYYVTSAQKLYSFDNVNWQNYNNTPIRVEIGQTLYAKGIDKNGNQSKSVATYVAALRTDSIPPAGYDRDYNIGYKRTTSYIDIDPNMQGKNMRMRLSSHSNGGVVVVYYLNASGTVLTSNTYNTYATFYFTKTIPVGTTKIYITMQTANATIYEIEPYGN